MHFSEKMHFYLCVIHFFVLNVLYSNIKNNFVAKCTWHKEMHSAQNFFLGKFFLR